MEFSIDMPERNGIITTQSGAKFYLFTVLDAIEEFNKKCPKNGGILLRDHIGHIKEVTHITKSLRYENQKLVAEIELLNNRLKDVKIKPIIEIPLRFESGISVERVLSINNIYLEF